MVGSFEFCMQKSERDQTALKLHETSHDIKRQLHKISHRLLEPRTTKAAAYRIS